MTINDDLVSLPGCGIVGEERGYAGHTEDVNSDLVYMQQRYYDPSLGRFLSIDPLYAVAEKPATYNRYAYANNNPYAYTDPNGEIAILVPVAMFVAKEVAAEMASQATGGLSDFLSMRRMANKAARRVADTLKRDNKPGCSFGSSVQVLTADGYRPITTIEPGVHEVWTRDELSGELSLQPVLHALYAHYDEAVYIKVQDEQSGQTHIIASNTIHPFYVNRPADSATTRTRHVAYSTSDAQLKQRMKEEYVPGAWVAAAELSIGDRLLGCGGDWSTVVSVQQAIEPLTAYNIDVANTDTYFVKGEGEGDTSGVWVHNCDGKGKAGVPEGAPPPDLSPEGAGRTGAFREAKRQSGIPTSQQPSRVSPNLDKRGNVQPGKSYEFEVPASGGGTKTVTIRDDAKGHDYGPGNRQNRRSHFNNEAGDHFDY